MSSLLEKDTVRAYNERKLGRQPVLEPTHFNGGAILSLPQDKAAGNNLNRFVFAYVERAASLDLRTHNDSC